MNLLNVEKVEFPAGIWPFRKKRPTILVVEDDADTRAMIAECATHEGFDSVFAPTGEEAVKMLRENGKRYVLVMIDVGLPGMDGWELFHQLADQCPQARVWLMSGSHEHLLRDHPEGVVVETLLKPSTYFGVFRKLKHQL